MSHWTWDPAIVSSLVVSGGLYAAGAIRLWRDAGRSRRALFWRSVSFASGWISLVVALLSPVAAISERLLSVHMTQHELLMVVAAPLFVLAQPLGVFVWGLPRGWRGPVGRWALRPPIAGTWRALTGPLTVWILHGAALWVWHLPALYQAAVLNDGIHAWMHVCFFFTAALFWWSLVHGRYGRLGYGIGVVFVFTTGLHATLLGALLTVAPRPWYAVYRSRAALAGLDPLADQQLAGLLMWVPFGIVFVIVGLALFAAWLGEAERRVALTRASAERPSGRIVPMLLVALVAGAARCGGDAAKEASRWTGGEPSRGKATIRKFGCASCHTIPGVPGADGLVGPPLDRIASRGYIAGHLTNTPANMMRFLAHPHGTDPRTSMPEMGIPDRDVRDIAAYLYTLR